MFDTPINLVFTILGFLVSLWWIWLPIILFLFVKDFWISNARQKGIAEMDWVLLEIKPPKAFEKTPFAMEQVFAGLHGFQSTPNGWEKNIKGKVQDWFSFEMVGHSGDIKFYVRTRPSYRNFVEAQIYAQYPQAEISQVDDYATMVPKDIPTKDYDLWGTELIFTNKDPYPIRTYLAFEKEAKKDEQRVDPLSSLTEVMAKLQEGEQIWIQTLVRPIDHKWQEMSQGLRDKMAGRKKEKKKSFVAEEIAAWGSVTRERIGEMASGVVSEGGGKKDEKFEKNALDYMTKIEKDAITALEEKSIKIGYEVIIRFLYLAPTSVFAKPNAGAVIGCYKQFSIQNLNGFKPNGTLTTKIDYGIQLKKPREYARKKKLLAAYQKRSYVSHSEVISYMRPLIYERLPIFKKFYIKSKPIILNIEELATIYHFPALMTETPNMSRVEAKRSGPPQGLPVK